jgi:hypothetical protein
MTDKKKNGWIKFVPSLDLPKERVSIAYDTHDERGYRFAYGYFQFHNGTCSSFWKDGNEQPKAVKVDDIKYWMPIPSFDSMQEEPVSNDLKEAADNALESIADQYDIISVGSCLDMFKMGAKWQKEQMMTEAKSGIGNNDNFIQFEDGTWIDLDPSMQLKPAFNVKEGEKVKVLIIKED